MDVGETRVRRSTRLERFPAKWGLVRRQEARENKGWSAASILSERVAPWSVFDPPGSHKDAIWDSTSAYKMPDQTVLRCTRQDGAEHLLDGVEQFRHRSFMRRSGISQQP
jgi:hypothetical protein